MTVATMDRVALWLAQGLGVGRMPRAPGTFGTLLAIPLYLAIVPLGWVWYMAVLALLFAVGVWLCGVAGRALRAGDHPSIVWDEIVGFLATMVVAPAGWWWVVAGFALFRLFDIWKPFPIRQIEQRVGGGLGVMLDDLLAAVYAWTVLKLVVVSGVL